jgi:hypothetical protein
MIERQPNTACTRLGVRAAFLELFRGFKLVPAKHCYLVPPQAGNASRSAVKMPIQER